VIESGKLPAEVIHVPVPPRRSISECIALLPEDSTATIDADFAKDVQAAVKASRGARTTGVGLILDSSALITATSPVGFPPVPDGLDSNRAVGLIGEAYTIVADS